MKFKAEINAISTRKKETPMMKAVQTSSVEAVKLLLDSGARVDMKNSKGQTALDIAKDMKDNERDREFAKNYIEKIIELLIM